MLHETAPTQSLVDDAPTELIRQRQALLEHEARYWLCKGYRSAERIEDLREFIGKQRGPAAVERLVEEMRNQWRRRQEWMHEDTIDLALPARQHDYPLSSGRRPYKNLEAPGNVVAPPAPAAMS